MEDDPYIQKLKELVLNLIDLEKQAVFLFGSRARGKTGKATDVDIGIWGATEVPTSLLVELRESVEESIIPYKVDFVDFASADPKFRKIALADIVIWNKPPTITLKEKT